MENIYKKNREIYLFDFMSSFAWTFLNFLARYAWVMGRVPEIWCLEAPWSNMLNANCMKDFLHSPSPHPNFTIFDELT